MAMFLQWVAHDSPKTTHWSGCGDERGHGGCKTSKEVQEVGGGRASVPQAGGASEEDAVLTQKVPNISVKNGAPEESLDLDTAQAYAFNGSEFKQTSGYIAPAKDSPENQGLDALRKHQEAQKPRPLKDSPDWHSCPSCGYCKHCGRGGYQQWPNYPMFPSYPSLPSYLGLEPWRNISYVAGVKAQS